MFIHLGDNVMVRSSDVITILDRQLLKSSSIVNEFLDVQKDRVVELSNGNTKSVVVTVDKVYYSPLSSSTLKKRSQHVSDFETILDEI
ncbi:MULTISPECIES: extracellular matrix regulator RemB [Fredinandcohnia]|uniref:Extracellular matrix regulator RemB n=1 Tax=Fredinandcohnia salidurans TaxID=2595041 RepID=A0ABW4MRI7_9BACI|nr:extracellular matrix/biofilm biosynthesis regulator RemA family protein [Fredinandcohnia onubensis]